MSKWCVFARSDLVRLLKSARLSVGNSRHLNVLKHRNGAFSLAMTWSDHYSDYPHQKLLGDGLSTPITLLSLICTISSELSVISD